MSARAAPLEAAAPPRARHTADDLVPSGPLRSDAVGLHPSARIATGSQPPRSVSLHAGPRFVPEHRAPTRASDGGLDIDAMIGARFGVSVDTLREADTGMKIFRRSSKDKELDKPLVQGEKKKGLIDSMKEQRNKLVAGASGLAARATGLRDKAVDKATGMDKFDYAVYGTDYELEKHMFTRKDETYTYDADHKLAEGAPVENALLATVNKTFDAKQNHFVVAPSDKLNPYQSTGFLSDKFSTEFAQKYHLLIPLDPDKGALESHAVPFGDRELFYVNVAKEQEKLMKHVVYRGKKGATETVSGVHPLCLGFTMARPLEEVSQDIGKDLYQKLADLKLSKQDFAERKPQPDVPYLVGISTGTKGGMPAGWWGSPPDEATKEPTDVDTTGVGYGKGMHAAVGFLVTPLSIKDQAPWTYRYENTHYDDRGFEAADAATVAKAKRDMNDKYKLALPDWDGAEGWESGKVVRLFSCVVHPLCVGSCVGMEADSACDSASIKLMIGAHPIFVPRDSEDITKYCIQMGPGTLNSALGHAVANRHIDMRLLWTALKLGRSLIHMSYDKGVPTKTQMSVRRILGRDGLVKMETTGAPLDGDELLDDVECEPVAVDVL